MDLIPNPDVTSEQRKHFAAIQFQAHILIGNYAREGFGDVVSFEYDFTVHSLPDKVMK